MASSTTTFDVNAARQAGYSDDEILQHLTTTRPFDVQGAMKNGYSTGEIIDYLSQTPKSSSVAGIPTPAKGTFAMRPEDLGITSPIPVTVPKPHSVDKLGGLLRSGPTYLPSPETVHMPGSFEGHPENNAVSALEVPRQGAQDIRDYIDQQARSMDPEDTTTPRLAHAYKNIVAPAGEASADFLGAQYRPENLATLGAFKYLPSSTAALRTAKTLAGAYYGGQSAITAGKEAGAAFDAAQQGDVPGAVEHGVNAAFQAGAATDAARDLHAQRSQVASDAAPLVRQTNDLVQRHLPNAITSRLPESIQTPNTVARAAARQAATQADNLSAGLEQGSQPPKGVMTREDVTQPILDDIRAEAARQGVTPETLEGRNGYQAMKKVTEAVRSRYDDAYNTLIEPIRNEYAGDAARQAANEVVSKMLDDASLMDEIKRGTPDGTNVTQLQNIAGTIAKARTVGELDNARIALNRLASRFEGKSEGQQYESPLVQEALSAGADAIRNSLYQDMAQRYGGVTVNGESVGVPEEEIRDLQRAHGAAIQADRMMGDTARVLSSRANEEAAPPGPMARFRGLGYRATMGSKQHAAAGLIEKLFPPSEVDLFNTRMQRAIKGASPDDGRVFPTPPITPEYVDPREVPDMRTSPVAPRLPAAPPFAEVVPPNRPAALPPFIKGELPPASRIYGTPEETAQRVDLVNNGELGSSLTPVGSTGNNGRMVRPAGQLPPPVPRNRALPPIGLFQHNAQPSNLVEAVGLPETAEGAALQNHFEQHPPQEPPAAPPATSAPVAPTSPRGGLPFLRPKALASSSADANPVESRIQPESLTQDRGAVPNPTPSQAPSQARGSANEPFVERRQNVVLRKRVDEMSPEERAHALLTSEKTGLPNYRAFQENADPRKPAVGYLDLDDFHGVNNRMTHTGVDEVILPAIGDLASRLGREMGVDLYHRSGDEFLARGASSEAVTKVFQRIQDELAQATYEYQTPDGKLHVQKGIGASYGTGNDEVSAEAAAKANKSDRKAAGLRLGARDEASAGVAAQGQQAGEGDAGREDLQQPQPQPTSERPARNLNTPGRPSEDVRLVDPKTLRVNPAEMQWRNLPRTAIPEGAPWDQAKAGPIDIWYNPEAKQWQVVDGHHRINHALKQGVPEIEVRVQNFSSLKNARTFGALRNIEQGNATPYDAAIYFRESQPTPADLQQYGVNPESELVRKGQALANLSPSLWEQYRSGTLDESKAVAIGQHFSDPSQQAALAKEAIKRKLSASEIEQAARRVKEAGSTTQQTSSLFGSDEKSTSNFFETARFADKVEKQLQQDKTALRFIANAPEARRAALARAENIINVGKSTEEAMLSSALAEGFRKLQNRSGLVQRLLDEAGARITSGENRNVVYQETYPKIREAILDEIGGPKGSGPNGGGQGGSQNGSGEGPQGGQAPQGSTSQEPDLFRAVGPQRSVQFDNAFEKYRYRVLENGRDIGGFDSETAANHYLRQLRGEDPSDPSLAQAHFVPATENAPARVELNPSAMRVVSFAIGRNIEGVRMPLERVGAHVSSLYDLSDKWESEGHTEAAKRINDLAGAISKAAAEPNAKKFGVLVFDATKPMAAAEEMIHGTMQAAPGEGSIDRGVPHEVMADHPVFQAMAERISAESGAERSSIQHVAEGFADLLLGEHPEVSKQDAVGAIHDYVSALSEKQGETAIEQFEQGRKNTMAVLQSMGIMPPEGFKHAGEAVRRLSARREAGRGPVQRTERGIDERQHEKGRPDQSATGGTRGEGEQTTRPAESPLSAWVREARTLEVTPAGEQNDLFGNPEPMYRLTRTDANGDREHFLVTESQYQQLQNDPQARRALSAGKQSSLFGEDEVAQSQIHGAQAKPSIQLPPQASKDQPNLFRMMRAGASRSARTPAPLPPFLRRKK